MLRFSVLGPVRIWRDNEPLPSGTPQQHALLAALLLREGRTATASELIDAIWGEDPPQQALATIRTYASRLRKMLDPGILATESGGYAIRTPADSLDLGIARRLAADADRARAAGDHALAHTLIARALDLWEGEPLTGVPGPHADTERARLAEWRLQLLEIRIDLELQAGRHAETVSELVSLAAAHPLRERLRELLMLALYRSGRQAEALAVYADTRRLLADELGVDPTRELITLHARILRADPELASPMASHTAITTTLVIAPPAQLPATVPDFTGRDALIAELRGILSGTGGAGRVRVLALSAFAGVGKTTLAVHVAHAARADFPDGQLYVDLQGNAPRPAEPETVLAAFLRALGAADEAIPDTPAERSALFRSMLDSRRLLVLLDNARDAAQVQPLLPGTGRSAAVITSRVRMMALPGAHLVDLDVMSPEEARLLFTRIVGHERVAAERHAVLDVVGACGFLPLAIRIAAARLAARRTWTVSVLAAKLADERRRLDELQAGDLAVKAAFELGYGQLEPAQARAFRLLGLADGPDISTAAAAAVLDLPEYEAEDMLESLVDASLLESAAPGRYRYHDLVRLYARACAERDEQPASGQAAALSRLVDFYLATAAAVYALERPGDRLVEHLSVPRRAGLVFEDGSEAVDWLYGEAACLLACVRQQAAAGSVAQAADLLWAAKDLADAGADASQYETTATAVREAARAAGDARAEARARIAYTSLLLASGRFEQADQEARLAVQLAHACGDPLPVGAGLHDRGVIAAYQNRHAEAERFLTEALGAYRADRNRLGEAGALSVLSRVRVETGGPSDGIEPARRALAIFSAMGLTLREANCRYALGIALTQAGRPAEALEELSKALTLFHEHQQRLWEGMTNFRIAETHLAARQYEAAALHAERALALGSLGGERRRAGVLTVLGRAWDRLGRNEEARGCWSEALSIYERVGDRPETTDFRELATSGLITV
ncbi:BTAD domain-containing putative transcriptional regulator [Streptomyces sp. AP-93]|uniref:AfsR/SARP family transcriptional regulator n=1 Tax=Streptomyces sp. AP-93 TaxID=2929048 RepID=UPI002435E56E|nr:BTAD domain-containing putative transcriptional regulator [Streptomyces sp. AP-93]